METPAELRFAVDGSRRVLDLAPVRERLGTHWPHYSDSVLMIAEKVSRKEIGPRDRLTREADALVIVFEAPNTRAAVLAQTKVAKALTQLLFGDGLIETAGRRARPSPGAKRAGRGERRRFGRWFAALFQRLRWGSSRADRTEASDTEAQEASRTDGPSIVREPVAASGGAETSGEETAVLGPAPAPSGGVRAAGRAAAISGSRPPVPLARFARGDDDEIRRIEWAIFEATLRASRANAEFGAAVEERLAQVRFTYRPLWHVGGRALVAYRCTPVLIEDDRIIEGEGVLPNPISVDQRIVLDQLAMANVIVDIEALLKTNLDSVIVVPVHFTSFAVDWSCGALSKLCQYLPAAARRRLVFDVMDAAVGRTDARFPAVVRTMKPFCGRLGAGIPLRTRDMRYWRELGFMTAVADVTDCAGSEQDLVADLDRFALTARREGLRSTALGLKSRSMILAAATMGFDFVHGSPISYLAAMGVMERVPFDFADLYES